MLHYRIRNATPEDIGEIGDNGIRDLYNKVRRHERAEGRSPLSPPSYAGWARMMERQAEGEVAPQILVAEDTKGQIIGFALANHRTEQGYSNFGKLVVDPDAQGEGIGQKLIANVMESAKRQGIGEIRLSAQHGEEHASGYYQKLGFEVTDTRTTKGGLAVDELSLDLSKAQATGRGR